ncbi:MAG: lipid A biosynthesis acyltransferase [Bacteroidota bacterium]
MAEWSGKSRGGLLGYRIFVLSIKYLHIYFAYLLLRFVAFYFLIFSDKKPIKFYFREILGYSKIKTVFSIYKNFCLLGEMLIDKIAFLTGSYNKFTFTFEGEENLHQMVASGKGGLLIGAHMGNWEMAGQLLERVSSAMNIVMLEAEHRQIDQYLKDVLVKKNIRIIGIKDDLSHLVEIGNALNRNEMVAIHGDRFLPGADCAGVNFMGRPALLPTGPLYMASKFKVPVSFVVTVKERKTHYHFYATPGKEFPYPSRLLTRKEELRSMVQEYASVIESRLKQYPLQWFNYYQFWE